MNIINHTFAIRSNKPGWWRRLNSVLIAGVFSASPIAADTTVADKAAAEAVKAVGMAPQKKLLVAEAAVGSESTTALLNLLDTIREVQTQFVSAKMGVNDAYTAGEANRVIAHILQTGLQFWLEANPSRPEFKQYVTTNRKLLGDNPDSVYYFAAINDDQTYIIRGNLGAAVFTSFTIEGGSQEGNAASRSISAISDNEMEVGADGSYTITVSRKKPASGNWLKLEKGAGQITTRHYHEAKLSVAADSGFGMDINIEAIDPKPLKNYGGDAEVAAKLNYVANFIRGHAPMSMTPTSPEMAKALGWVSIEPNVLAKPGQWISASGDQAYGNTHAFYSSAPYSLADDEALVIEGSFPQARFANVVLWNRYMQSYDFTNRQISLNRQQITYEEDGSFKIVVAHEDPGVPNWLDTEGRNVGQMYWRWVFPRSEPTTPVARVVKLKDLRK